METHVGPASEMPYDGCVRSVILIAALAGCSYSPPATDTDAATTDASTDAPVTNDDASDSSVPCVPGFLDLCSAPAASAPLTVTGAQTIDTDNDPRCHVITQVDGPDVCVVLATTVDVQGGAVLTAFGSRALAIASASTLTITGEIDVSSRRGGNTGPAARACTFGSTPENDGGGGGGGAGGTIAAPGGGGGTGDMDQSIGMDANAPGGTPGQPIATPVTVLLGGCVGQKGGNQSAGGNQGGAGGAGGGGLYLVASSISLAGQIRATGAGGSGGAAQAGGGGGGAGGIVVIEAQTIAIAGEISANGGGGGEGGANVGGTPITGGPGDDGTYGTTAAAGGAGNDDRFGFGGAGGVNMTLGGTVGRSSDASGGGGGGSVGVIRLLGTRSGNGLLTPPAS
jgi:hypothetical protein